MAYIRRTVDRFIGPTQNDDTALTVICIRTSLQFSKRFVLCKLLGQVAEIVLFHHTAVGLQFIRVHCWGFTYRQKLKPIFVNIDEEVDKYKATKKGSKG